MLADRVRMGGGNLKVDDKSGIPGSNMLIAGTMEEGFFGEVPASELITGDALASECGISQGTSQHSTAGWLKFAYKGDILFVAKKPIRNSISWMDLDGSDCVFGNKNVVIGGLEYKVRLFRGTLNGYSSGAGDRGGKGSEWNKLIHPISIRAKDNDWRYPEYVDDDLEYWGIDYTDDDLGVVGDGRNSWCQESNGTYSRVYRLLDIVNSTGRTGKLSTTGWRPVLELV